MAQIYTTIRKTQEVVSLKENAHYIGLLLFIALMYLRNLVGISISPVLLLVFYVVLEVRAKDVSELFALMLSTLVWTSAFQYKYALLAGILVYFVKFGNSIKANSTIIPILLLFAWEVLHAVYGEFSFSEYLRSMTEWAVLLVVLNTNKSRLNVSLIVRTVVISTTFTILLLLLVTLLRSGDGLSLLFSGSFRLGWDYNNYYQATYDSYLGTASSYSLVYNPNTLGMICAICISGLLICRFSGDKRKLDMAFFGLLLSFGLLTISRNFLLTFFCLGVFALWAERVRFETVLKMLFGLFAAAFLVALLLPEQVEAVFASFSNRIVGSEDISGGRIDLLSIYGNILFSDQTVLFFGTGLQNPLEVLQQLGWTPFSVPHNSTQQLFVVWGIPGFILLLATLITAIRNLSCGLKLNYSFIMLFVVLFATQSGQLVTSGSAMLGLSLALLCLLLSAGTDLSSSVGMQKSNDGDGQANRR